MEMVPTLRGGNMSRGIVSALPVHCILEEGSQVAAGVSLEEVVEVNGVVALWKKVVCVKGNVETVRAYYHHSEMPL
jgi:hypothetical protein